MKKTLIIATTLCALSAAHVHAQWIVYDPSVHTQTILNGVQEIAKFIEVINNQVQQIQSLKNQLDEFKRYESVFGDPSQVLLTTVKPLTDDLKKTEVGRTLAALEGTANAGQAMLYNAGGLFHSIGTEFTTPGGQKVKRREAEY